MATLGFFTSIVVFCGSQVFFFFLQTWLKKSTSDNIQISKHTTRDALLNSKTSAYKAS